MRSMTGFGAASVEEAGLALRAEVRAVNHRFLQLKQRLPAELGHLENEVEQRVRKRIERGALNLSVSAASEAALHPPKIDVEAARRYKRELERVARELGIGAGIDLGLLAGLPGVIGGPVDARELAREEKLVLRVVEQALDSLQEMREREGAALLRDLRRGAKAIAALATRISRRMPKVVRAHQEALEKRVAELLDGRGALSEGDLAREIALLAERMDVSEELARLASHLDQLEVLLSRDGQVGRQLDFLVQELLREANTVGSKCNDAPVAHLVVELKTWIERLREQAQNVE